MIGVFYIMEKITKTATWSIGRLYSLLFLNSWQVVYISRAGRQRARKQEGSAIPDQVFNSL